MLLLLMMMMLEDDKEYDLLSSLLCSRFDVVKIRENERAKSLRNDHDA